MTDIYKQTKALHREREAETEGGNKTEGAQASEDQEVKIGLFRTDLNACYHT